MVMTGETHVRLNYSNTSDDQARYYVALLERQGLAREYIAYVVPGAPDDSAERLAHSEFDAVDAVSGEYHLRLEAGGATATLDIDTSGFEAEAMAASAVAWPCELAPEPPRCPLVSVTPTSDPGFHVSCRPDDDRVEQDYLQALIDAGFAEESRVEAADGKLLDVTLRRSRTPV
jgi:hypothetical protein